MNIQQRTISAAKQDFEREWLGKGGLTYRRGGEGDKRYPTTITYEDCTVRDVLWPGSVISNDEGEWVAFRFRLRTSEGRQVTTDSMPSPIPAVGQ